MDLIGHLIGSVVVRNIFEFSLRRMSFAKRPIRFGQCTHQVPVQVDGRPAIFSVHSDRLSLIFCSF